MHVINCQKTVNKGLYSSNQGYTSFAMNNEIGFSPYGIKICKDVYESDGNYSTNMSCFNYVSEQIHKSYQNDNSCKIHNLSTTETPREKISLHQSFVPQTKSSHDFHGKFNYI